MLNLKIKTLSTFFIIGMTFLGLSIATTSYINLTKITEIKSLWELFDAQRNEKSKAIIGFQVEIGYGGMIHHFKNYILRHKPTDKYSVITNIGGAKARIKLYESLPHNQVEADALSTMNGMLVEYSVALELVSDLINQGETAEEIDDIVKIKDTPSIDALHALESEYALIDPDKQYQAYLLRKLRLDLGYGGFIHHYKNYILRKSPKLLMSLEDSVVHINNHIKEYSQLLLNDNELKALQSFKLVIDSYTKNIPEISMMIAEGMSAQEIDALVYIDDTPAFDALGTLQSEFIQRNEIRAKKLHQAVDSIYSLEGLVLIITILTLTLFIAITIWLFQYRILSPLAHLTSIMSSLANNNLDVEIRNVDNQNEIGDMARSVAVFKANAHSLLDREMQLKKSKEEAEKANKAKSEFLSSMSHELRTPLNAILGFAQLLESDEEAPLTEEQHDNMAYILSGGQHLLNLINDILELTAIETGKTILFIEPLNLRDVIDDSLSLLTPLANKANIQIHVLSDLVFTVSADYTKLKQIIINLITNAIKYNHEGGSVSLDWESTKNNTVRINVIDTGIGISEANKPKVFGAFNRLGQENSSIEGTGIGLVVTKDLIEMMDGEIGFESTENKGSTFWFELPIAEAVKSHQNI